MADTSTCLTCGLLQSTLGRHNRCGLKRDLHEGEPCWILDHETPEPAASSDHIIDAAQEALDCANAPICYLHRDARLQPFAVVIEVWHWHKILALIPKGEEITELVMNHGHVGDD